MSASGPALTYIEPLALEHTWPLTELPGRFELDFVLSRAVTDIVSTPDVGELNWHHIGCWECDLSDNSLTWSAGVYDIFGLPRDAKISREECVTLYSEESRIKMERLRAYSIKHRRGFTLDVDIRSAVGEERRVRLIAAPICSSDRVVRLHGLKLVI